MTPAIRPAPKYSGNVHAFVRPLEAVGTVAVPDTVLDHYFVKEAHSWARVFDECDDRAPRDKVIGTENVAATGTVQLYGWARNVAAHIDDCGYAYFTPIVLRQSRVYTEQGFVRLTKGTVYRLDDRKRHWTFDLAPVVAAFIGPWVTPDDERAVALIAAGIQELAKGSHHAPRVNDGFRIPAPWEVFNQEGDLVDAAELARAGGTPAECALCSKPAVKLDRKYPWFIDYNRCREHLR